MIIRSRAPLRLGLAGGGTDVSPYCDQFGGCVLNTTISKYAYCTLEPLDTPQIEFNALDLGETETLTPYCDIPSEGGLLLHKGVYNRIVKEFWGGKPLPVKVSTYSDAPMGSGLGSSSTLVVTMIQAYAEWLNLPLGEYDVARIAYEVEREELKLAGGKQDQYAAAFGGFNFIEFYADNKVIVNPLRIKDWVRNELECSIVLYFTGKSRSSAAIISDQMKNISQEKTLSAMHNLKAEAYSMKEAVLKGDFGTLMECVRQGWEHKKNTSSSVSNPMIEETLALATANGAKAAKISGAGGGGFIMFLCSPLDFVRLSAALQTLRGNISSVKFSSNGAEAWVAERS